MNYSFDIGINYKITFNNPEKNDFSKAEEAGDFWVIKEKTPHGFGGGNMINSRKEKYSSRFYRSGKLGSGAELDLGPGYSEINRKNCQ